MGDLELELVSLEFWQNCMPIVAEDPVHAFGSITVSNFFDADASASVVEARFVDAGGDTVITFEIDPSDTGVVPGGSETLLEFTKVAGSSEPQSFCETLTCGAMYSVEIVFSDGVGEDEVSTGLQSLLCPV